MPTVKESDICSGREIYHIGRIKFGPIGYQLKLREREHFKEGAREKERAVLRKPPNNGNRG